MANPTTELPAVRNKVNGATTSKLVHLNCRPFAARQAAACSRAALSVLREGLFHVKNGSNERRTACLKCVLSEKQQVPLHRVAALVV